MIRVVVGLFFITLIDWVNGQGIIFEDDGRHFRPVKFNSSGFPIKRIRPLVNNPSSVDNLLQIPITVIQGTSVAAQTWSPQNGNTINKFFDIPVQTLQSIGNLIKDRNPEQNNLNQAIRRDRFLQIREIELKRRQQIVEQKRLQQQQRLDEQKLQNEKRKQRLELQHKMQEQKKYNESHPIEKRQARFFDLHGWSSALTDVLWDGFGLGHGHGHGYGLGNGHGNLFNHGGNNGGYGNILNGHKKKKKKKKKPIHGSNNGNYGNIWGGHGSHGGHGNYGSHGSHLGGHGGHLGGHGSHQGGYGGHLGHGQGSHGVFGHGQGSNGIYGGLQQIFSGLNHQYQVTEDVDDIIPQRPIFGWQKPFRDNEKIENKIAPGFDENSRSNS